MWIRSGYILVYQIFVGVNSTKKNTGTIGTYRKDGEKVSNRRDYYYRTVRSYYNWCCTWISFGPFYATHLPLQNKYSTVTVPYGSSSTTARLVCPSSCDGDVSHRKFFRLQISDQQLRYSMKEPFTCVHYCTTLPDLRASRVWGLLLPL